MVVCFLPAELAALFHTACCAACLQEARTAGQRVVVCSHLCIHPDTCHGACLLWNYPDVLEVGGAGRGRRSSSREGE